MSDDEQFDGIFPSAAEDVERAKLLESYGDSYRLAYTDDQFLLRDDLRAVRLQLEWLKPDLIQEELGVESTVVVFGGARFPEQSIANEKLESAKTVLSKNPNDADLIKKYEIAKAVVENSRYYTEARELAKKITKASIASGGNQFIIVTGGGPGVMEAANRGAADVGGKSIGLNIVLPFEQKPNTFITKELCFQFHYFAIRKMHFLKRARALVAYPGGFGTLDELFETLTLIQTKKIKPLPIILMGRNYWTKLIDFDFLVEQGAIDECDLSLFEIVDSADEAWNILKQSWGIN